MMSHQTEWFQRKLERNRQPDLHELFWFCLLLLGLNACLHLEKATHLESKQTVVLLLQVDLVILQGGTPLTYRMMRYQTDPHLQELWNH